MWSIVYKSLIYIINLKDTMLIKLFQPLLENWIAILVFQQIMSVDASLFIRTFAICAMHNVQSSN